MTSPKVEPLSAEEIAEAAARLDRMRSAKSFPVYICWDNTFVDRLLATIESLRSTIEAQGQEIERLKVIQTTLATEAQTYYSKIATKDAILRECAKTFRELLGGRPVPGSELMALAAKCEAAIGEK